MGLTLRPEPFMTSFAASNAALTPTEDLDQIIERGITWNLAAAVPVGQFASGDYFTVGGAVTSTAPISEQQSGTYDNAEAFTDRWVHGLMIDPGSEGGTGTNPTNTPQGFDSLPKAPAVSSVTEFAYSHALNKDPAVTGSISGVKTLVKAFSIETNPQADSRKKLSNVSVLTLLDAIPPAGSFRRWAGAASKTPIFFTSDIDWSVLPSLAKPASAATLVAADLIAKLGPLQTYMNQQLYARGIAPTGVQNDYGADIANDVLQAMLFTMTSGTSEADRNAVGYRLIQAGLDIYDATEAGRRWSSSTFSFGGAHQWLKILLIYAARLLHNAANATERNKLIAWCDGTTNKIFAEDYCTLPITRAGIESTQFESLTTRIWPQGYPDWSENSIEWLGKPSSFDSAGLSYEIAYRTINGYPFLTTALVTRLLGGEAIWNAPKFFEYCDTFYNRWTQRGQPTDSYFYAYCRYFVIDYYTANSPAYSDASAPTLVRRAANGRYAWIEVNEPFKLDNQPAATDLTVEVDGSGVSLTAVATTCSATASSGSTNVAQPVITVASATGIKVGQRVVCAGLRPNTFVSSVSGTTIGISSHVAATISAGTAVTFENVFVWGRSLVAVLPTPLTVDTQPVNIGYTAPGSGFVRNLGGVGLATQALAAATNYTGLLPDGPASKDLAYSGSSASPRQYSGGVTPRSETINRLRCSVRFMLESAFATNENLICASSPSTTTFRVYAASASAGRILIGGSASQSIRNATWFSGLPLDTLITLHFFLDGTQTTQTAAKKAALVWSGGGSNAIDTSTSTGTLDGSWSAQLATILANGLFAFANGSGNDPFHGSIKEITLGWGDGTLPLPADLTGAEFAHDADWGDNGEGPWGQNQWYFAGPLSEWNGGMPNRGNYGAYSLTGRRYVDPLDSASGLSPEYASPP